jgi:hypothetical protein
MAEALEANKLFDAPAVIEAVVKTALEGSPHYHSASDKQYLHFTNTPGSLGNVFGMEDGERVEITVKRVSSHPQPISRTQSDSGHSAT